MLGALCVTHSVCVHVCARVFLWWERWSKTRGVFWTWTAAPPQCFQNGPGADPVTSVHPPQRKREGGVVRAPCRTRYNEEMGEREGREGEIGKGEKRTTFLSEFCPCYDLRWPHLTSADSTTLYMKTKIDQTAQGEHTVDAWPWYRTSFSPLFKPFH